MSDSGAVPMEQVVELLAIEKLDISIFGLVPDLSDSDGKQLGSDWTCTSTTSTDHHFIM